MEWIGANSFVASQILSSVKQILLKENLETIT